MSQLVACPECKKHLQVPEDLLGKKVQCPECKHTFVAKAEEDAEEEVSKTSTTAKPPPSKKAAWDKKKADDDDDDDDDRKSKSIKKRPRDDDDDDDDDDDRRERKRKRSSSSRRGNYAPHRGGMIMAFGLIGLIGHFVMLGYISFVFGIIAWIMGNTDMAEIKAGRMDPEGEGQTNAGRIMGMISTIIFIVGLVLGCGFVIVWFLFCGVMVAGAGAAAQQQQKNMQNMQQPPPNIK